MACIPMGEKFPFVGGESLDIQIGEPQVKAIVRTTAVRKNFSRINGVSRFSDRERAVRLINYLRRTFMKNKLKIVITPGAELRETEKRVLQE